MRLRASAPGKLVLLGEYAVLDGAPALVMAVDRRAVATLEVTDGRCHVYAPTVHPTVVGFDLAVDGTPRWHDDDPQVPQRLQLVTQVCRALAMRGLLPVQPFQLTLDSAAFFDDVSGAKLGLGSSAAMTTALASVLAAAAGHDDAVTDRSAWLQTLLQIHREFQQGRGSGVDVAAAVCGGIIRFQLVDGRVEVQPVAWPESLQRLWLWSGQSASTADFLQTLAAWRSAAPRSYEQRMGALMAVAELGAAAAAAGDAAALRNALSDAGDALQALGQAGKMAIFSPEHRRIADIVSTAGGIYKPCGAGGGDVGLAVADEADAAPLHDALHAAGLAVLDLGVDDAGLVVESMVDGD